MTEAAIRLEEVVKTYHATRRPEPPALRGVTFSIQPGEIVGLLGPNGAGKTTIVKILATVLRPTSGRAAVLGHDVTRQPDEVRRLLGYAAQDSGLDLFSTARQNLALLARFYRLPRAEAARRIDEMLDRFQLGGDWADRPLVTFSTGMRKRIELASALIHQPPVLILDEPTLGLDPPSRAGLWEAISVLGRSGVSVLLATHYLDEADRLADRVAILDRGEIVAQGTPQALKESVSGDRVSLRLTDPQTMSQALEAVKGAGSASPVGTDGVVHVRVEHGDEAIPRLIRALAERGVDVASVELARPTLDDVFLRYTGRLLADADALPTMPGGRYAGRGMSMGRGRAVAGPTSGRGNRR
jgi:ABC-2 type transport system ATP-binding protein